MECGGLNKNDPRAALYGVTLLECTALKKYVTVRWALGFRRSGQPGPVLLTLPDVWQLR